MVLGNHPCLPPVILALPEDPPRDSACCKQVVRFVRCSRYEVDPRFQLVFWIVCCEFVEAGGAVCVVAAFFVLVEVFDVVLNRVVHRFAVMVVGLDVGGVVATRGMCNCVTFTCYSLCCQRVSMWSGTVCGLLDVKKKNSRKVLVLKIVELSVMVQPQL